MKTSRFGQLCTALAAACMSFTAFHAGAQPADFPNRPISIVTPFAPGGTDLAIRHYTDSIAASNPQWRFVIDYKQGAGGAIANGHVAKSAPDGYTHVVSSTTLLLIDLMEVKPPYTEKEFDPVYLLTSSPQLVVVHQSVPIGNMKEFVAYAKANPGKLNWGMVGNAGVQRMVVEYMQELYGIRMALIPYKGTGTIGPAILSGEITATFQAPRNLLAGIKAGKIRALAHSGKPGFIIPELPDVRSIGESGVPAFENFGWIALHAPAGTPLAIRARINRMFDDARKTPEVIKRFRSTGDTPGGGTIEDFEKYMDVQRDRWHSTAKRLGIKLTP
jgi:tripartite-type tricarboxylate transporter receptor subunit TctC